MTALCVERNQNKEVWKKLVEVGSSWIDPPPKEAFCSKKQRRAERRTSRVGERGGCLQVPARPRRGGPPGGRSRPEAACLCRLCCHRPLSHCKNDDTGISPAGLLWCEPKAVSEQVFIIHSAKYELSSNHVPGPARSAGDRGVTETDRRPCPCRALDNRPNRENSTKECQVGGRQCCW